MLNDWFLQVGRECLFIYVCRLIRHLVIKESGECGLQTIIKIFCCEFHMVSLSLQNSFTNFCGAHICSLPLVVVDEEGVKFWRGYWVTLSLTLVSKMEVKKASSLSRVGASFICCWHEQDSFAESDDSFKYWRDSSFLHSSQCNGYRHSILLNESALLIFYHLLMQMLPLWPVFSY